MVARLHGRFGHIVILLLRIRLVVLADARGQSANAVRLELSAKTGGMGRHDWDARHGSTYSACNRSGRL